MLYKIVNKLKGIEMGAIPSPLDTRDFTVDKCVSGIGLNSVPDSLFFPVFGIHKQQPVARCVGETLGYLREWEEAKIFNIVRGQEDSLSSGFIYFNRHKHGEDGSLGFEHAWQQKGMYMREALKSLLNDGVCLSSVYANSNEYNSKVVIPEKAFIDAKQRVLDSYFSCTSWDERKEAMVANGPLAISVPCYTYWSPGRNLGVVRAPVAKDTLIGYHAMVLTGYNADGSFTCISSWGPTWNTTGTVTFAPDYPIRESWGIVDANSPVSAKPLAKKHKLTIYYNNERLMPATEPIIVNDRILVPVRFIFETLGATVEWVQEEQLAYAKKYTTEVKMWVGSNRALIIKDGKVNEFTLDVPLLAVDGKTFAPLRFVCEAFGNKVFWDGDYQRVDIA